MTSRKNLMSLAAALLTMVVILAGCVQGSTVRTSNNSGGSSPTPTASGSATASPTASGSPTASPSATAGTGSVTILDNGRTNVFDVATDDTNAYYTLKIANNGFVLAVAKDGLTPAVVLAQSGDANTPWGVACDSGTTGNVYYTNFLGSAQGTLMRVPKPVNGVAQGSPVLLASTMNFPTFVRLNNLPGGDGLLYVTENITNDGRILRYRTDQLNQSRDVATWVTEAGDAPAAYNLRLFPVSGGGVIAAYTLMDANLTTGSNGQIRAKLTSAAAGGITGTTLIATGLLNPTDLTTFNGNVYWTEYDPTSGGVRTCKTTDLGVRGTNIGQATGSDSLLPPVALRVDTTNNIIFVTRNLQQVNGGAFVEINLATNVSKVMPITSGGQVSGGVDLPFQFAVSNVSGGSQLFLFTTDFNFSQGANGLATQPSALSRVQPVNVFAKTAGTGDPKQFDTEWQQ